MALIRSKIAAGIAMVATAAEARVVVSQKATHVFTKAAAAGDIVELAVLPAYHHLISARLYNPDALTLGTTGVLSGDVGADTNQDGSARTVGAAIVDNTGLLDAGLAITSTPAGRSIGVTLGAGGAAAGKSICLLLTYAQ